MLILMLYLHTCTFCSLYRLTNLFSGLDEKSTSRADVYLALLKLGHQSDLLHLVITDLKNVSKRDSFNRS